MITLIIGAVIGGVLDNIFAPKIKIENGKITFEYSTKKIK
jgi:hypothetical protein